MRKRKKNIFVVLFALVLAMFALTACTAVQVSGDLVLNADESGTRKLEARIAKNDYVDGYGSAYYYFKQHGTQMADYIKNVYTEKVPGSQDWLSVSVDDSGEEWEIVTLSFDFSSFDDYTEKLKSLAYDESASSKYADPEFIKDEAGNVTYKESVEVMTSIYKGLQNTIMADDSMYDPACTKDGVALNDGSADGQLEDGGVELMKAEYGNAMTIQFNDGEETPIEAVDGVFVYSVTADGKKVEKSDEVSCVLEYTFEDSLANSGTEAENDLSYGTGSTEGGPVFEEGNDGKAVKLDGKSYLASPNKTYSYEEMTVSFDYRMDEYTDTDSGANMVIVPAGLGALGSGMIDIEYIKDEGSEGIQVLGKMNSSDWQTQDKLFSEGYYMEAHMSEWHNYTFVFQNEYDEEGTINDAFMYMYIDGKLANKTRLSVAAGLPYNLGTYDDGSAGEPNGGFNIGGYYEEGVVKRACTGLLDNFRVFNGALTEEEIQTLCYTAKVEKEYNPDVIDTVQSDAQDTEAETNVNTDKTEESGNAQTTVIIVIAAVLVVVVAAVVVTAKRKKKTAEK